MAGGSAGRLTAHLPVKEVTMTRGKQQIPQARLEGSGEALSTLSLAEDCQKGSGVLYFRGVGTAATKTVHKSTGTSSAYRSENRQREMIRCLDREGETQQAWALQTFLHLSVTHSFLPGMGQNLPVQSEKGVTDFLFGHTQEGRGRSEQGMLLVF